MKVWQVDPDAIKAARIRRGLTTFGLWHIELIDKNSNSVLKLGWNNHQEYEVILEASERIVGVSAYVD